jgi:hypothetical protein
MRRRAFLFASVLALAACASSRPEPLPEYIGMAQMAADGTLTLDLEARGCDGEIGHARLVYPVTDPRYRDILAHVGDIRPGESRPVRPWPYQGC